tara:strand:+ start:2146 stop:2409 length:264 start_codon:yes stop_codon:yes gene_type:complete
MLNNKNGKLYVGDKEVIKGYESFSGWYWFATEIEEEDYGGHPLYFGYVQGFENEWGSFWYGELEPLIKQGRVWEINEVDLPHAGRRD